MENMKQLQEERAQLFKDVYDGKIPKRVPIELSITWDAAIQYAGLDLKEAQYNPEMYPVFFDKVAKDFQADKSPIAPTLRPPAFYNILGSVGIVMSDKGSMQHPEVHSLEVEEYDEFIADPYKCMVETCLPRIYKALDASPGEAALAFAKAFKAKNDYDAIAGKVTVETSEKYGYPMFPRGGFTEAPMDFIADFLRSFTGVVMDMRRNKEKLLGAIDAITPHMKKIGVVPTSSRYARTFIPLHMAPFMREKQFAQFWWPSFKDLMDHLRDNDAGVRIFVEGDWMDKIDYLATLDNRVEMQFEYGDPKLAKEKVGKDHIISGFYPITMLQTNTKQQCVDKARELIDILAPGGGFIFNTDKSLYSLEGPIAENLQAVLEVVRTEAVY